MSESKKQTQNVDNQLDLFPDSIFESTNVLSSPLILSSASVLYPNFRHVPREQTESEKPKSKPLID